MVDKQHVVQLSGAVACGEVYVTSGHKGQPDAVQKGYKGRRSSMLETGKPPILGMIERGGEVVFRIPANVQQVTIQPLITSTVAPGSLVYTDEYDTYARLEPWGCEHQTAYNSAGKYARDGDGICEVHVNTIEGVWSLLRFWLRPHHGISPEKLPLYLSFFEFVHNARKRDKALMGSLLETLLH